MVIFRKIIVLMCIIMTVCVLSAFRIETEFELAQSIDHKDFAESHNVKILKSVGTKYPIYSFDVNDNGDVALAISNSQFHGVVVYDKYGNYLYGFELECNGSIYVEFSSTGVNVILVRGDIIAAFDENGNCLSVYKCMSSENNSKYANYLCMDNVRYAADREYRLENSNTFLDKISSEHSKLIIVEPDGTEKIIYEANTSPYARTLIFGIIWAIISIPVIILNNKIRKRIQNHQSNIPPKQHNGKVEIL